MKITYNGELYVLNDYHLKVGALSMKLSKGTNFTAVRSDKSVSNVIINVLSLYLNGEYLKGGRM